MYSKYQSRKVPQRPVKSMTYMRCAYNIRYIFRKGRWSVTAPLYLIVLIKVRGYFWLQFCFVLQAEKWEKLSRIVCSENCPTVKVLQVPNYVPPSTSKCRNKYPRLQFAAVYCKVFKLRGGRRGKASPNQTSAQKQRLRTCRGGGRQTSSKLAET